MDMPEHVIEPFLRTGTANIRKEYLDHLISRLRPRMMKLNVLDGGGCLMKHFGKYDSESVVFVDDLRASAKDYEYRTQG